MAEKKYDLLLGPKRDSNLKIRNQPWYRERLKSKYDPKPKLDASSWTFIKDGLDDFRDGRPPYVADAIIKGNKGVLPNVSNSCDRVNPNQRNRKVFSKNEAIYSKTVPNQEKRRKKVEGIENNLLKHPLALYPHIGQSVSADTFEKIVELLDPSMFLGDMVSDTSSFVYDNNISGSSSSRSSIDDEETEDSEKKTSVRQDVFNRSGSVSPTESVSHEPVPGYRQAIKNVFMNAGRDSIVEELATEGKPSRTGRRQTLPSQVNTAASLSKIDCVTKDFCDWVRDLGGALYNIDEETVKNLFASGYETNPIVSAPVRIVELTNVPPDLRAKNMASQDIVTDAEIQKQSSYVPSWTKMKYGAWYLEPKLWKARPAGDLLQDPKELERKKISETREKSKELDMILGTSHGSVAFRKFIEKKGARKPVFAESILNNDESKNRSNIKSVVPTNIKAKRELKAALQ